MRWRVTTIFFLVSIWTLPLPLARADQTLQQRYLDIYLKINDAEHLEKQNDFRGALDDFKDCYAKLAKIHQSDPNWETALVVHRMDDCKAKILELQPKADAQAPPEPVTPPPAPVPAQPETTQNPPEPYPTATVTSPNPDSEEVASLKLQLQAVKEDLRITKEKLQDSQAQLETYRTQLETVNAQLAALKSQPTSDEKMAKLLGDNKALTDKLAAAQKEIDDLRTSPKSKLALAQTQLKNLQEQYDASQSANATLQSTTTSLKQQLDQAQADLVAANQKLASVPANSPDYETLKRENEVMRDILTRELQEQAHRDMAKRLAQEEFDNLKLKSKVLQEQLDILGSPMTPPTNDQERSLLASLKIAGPDVAPNPPNGFSAPAAGTPPSAPDQTTAMAPATNTAAGDNSTNQPPVSIVMNNPAATATETNAAPVTTSTNAAPSTPSTPATPPDTTTNAPSTTTAAVATPSTNAVDPNAPIPPNGQPPATTNVVSTPPTPPPPTGPTTTTLPPASTQVTDTTITHNTPADDTAKQSDPTQFSTKARLPDDMRDTAQEAADLFKNQKYDESAAKYQTIIDKYPESLYAWSNLGVVRFQQGKFDEALKALQQAVKLSPTDAFSYSNLGIVYYQLGQYENAIDALNSAKALDPNDAKTHNYLGCACSQKGWQEVAEKEFRKAIQIDPNFGDAHFNLALVLATSKPPSLELARREYNTALSLGIAKDPRLEKLLAGGPQP